MSEYESTLRNVQFIMEACVELCADGWWRDVFIGAREYTKKLPLEPILDIDEDYIVKLIRRRRINYQQTQDPHILGELLVLSELRGTLP